MKMPCRHIFAVREKEEITLLSNEDIPERWTMAYFKVVSAEFYFHKPMTVHLELYLFYCFIHFLLYIGQY